MIVVLQHFYELMGIMARKSLDKCPHVERLALDRRMVSTFETGGWTEYMVYREGGPKKLKLPSGGRAP